MHPKTCRLCLSIIPALFAFFLASVFAMALVNSTPLAALVGVAAGASSSALIMRH